MPSIEEIEEKIRKYEEQCKEFECNLRKKGAVNNE